ncbi:MAG: D-alanyl-D-alanine carboxypeptidase, partial [bacterium]|nr:D-alanyl-D-alanine carboxypeptidase [bacterium]
DFLTAIGSPRNTFEIVEGSGLSRFNTVNSDLYIRLLKYMYDDVKTFDFFYNSLSIAGRDGTLRNRMIGTEAEKNIHAKTGTLNSVSSLSGYAVSRDNELLIFYIAMNGFGSSANQVRYRQDLICEILCGFSRK